jgi:Flp pilus assembly protein TadD
VRDVDRDPAASRAAAVRAYARAGREEYERSAEAFSQALRRDPNDWALHRDYGQVLLQLGRREKAQARMRRALALNPRMRLPPGFVPVKAR